MIFRRSFLNFGRILLFALLSAALRTPLLHAVPWTTQNSGTSSDLNSVHFVDANTGWVVGNNGVILNTTDRGTTWTAQNSSTPVTLRDVRFVDTSTGLVVGASGTILRTTDGGTTWTSVNSGVANNLYSVFWVDASTAFIAGDAGVILKSTDSGVFWGNGAPNGAAIANYKSIFFINSSTGWAVGDQSAYIRTFNGGQNWSTLAFGGALSLKQVFFVNTSTGWISADFGGILGIIYLSENSGTSFAFAFSTGVPLNSVHFIDTSNGWAVGTGGKVVISSNSGNSFDLEAATTTNTLNRVFFVDANTGFAVGASGTIIRRIISTPPVVIIPVETQQGSLKAINNMFDPTQGGATTIQYSFLNGGQVRVRIYTMRGRLVRTLLDENRPPGSYSDLYWDGKNDQGEIVASGIYLVHIEAPGFSKTQKIAVVK